LDIFYEYLRGVLYGGTVVPATIMKCFTLCL